MTKKLDHIEGIGPRYAGMLRAAGISTTRQLLSAGGDRDGRSALARRTGIDESLILKWVNMADLFRINGIAGQYAELLEAAGVDTVRELRARNPENLALRLREANLSKHMVRQVPGTRTLDKWIDQARELPPMISH